jgi:hypothetical protein
MSTSTWNEEKAVRGKSGAGTDGSFATHLHSEPEVGLYSDDPDANRVIALRRQEEAIWGSTGVGVGSRTPWGKADYVTEDAAGVTGVGTAGHGGIKLSPARNKMIPAPLRNSSGWYEEDTEASIVGMFIPESFPHIEDRSGFETSVKNWAPDGWEAATGGVLAPGESLTRDADMWKARHSNDFVVTSAIGNSAAKVVNVTARRASDGVVKDFIIGEDEYRARNDADNPNRETGQGYHFVVDPARHVEVPRKAEPVGTKLERFGSGTVTVPRTEAAQRLLNKDLGKRWQSSDGSVRTMQNILDTEGFTGKSAYVNGGRREYYLTQKDTTVSAGATMFTVSKATFDAVGAPDQRSAADVAGQDVMLAEDALDKLFGHTDVRRKAQLKVQDLKTKRDAAREAEARELNTPRS